MLFLCHFKINDNYENIRESPENSFDHKGNEVISSAKSTT